MVDSIAWRFRNWLGNWQKVGWLQDGMHYTDQEYDEFTFNKIVFACTCTEGR